MLIALLKSSSNETEKKETNKNPPTHKIALSLKNACIMIFKQEALSLVGDLQRGPNPK